jgi:hypothetical protein
LMGGAIRNPQADAQAIGFSAEASFFL